MCRPSRKLSTGEDRSSRAMSQIQVAAISRREPFLTYRPFQAARVAVIDLSAQYDVMITPPHPLCVAMCPLSRKRAGLLLEMTPNPSFKRTRLRHAA